jgi:hypothetical protein
MMTNPTLVADLTKAIESSDAQALIDLYSDDAIIRIIDKDHPPSAPVELRGKTAIADFYRDVCGRAMTHRIDSAVSDGDRLAFSESCTYPDGVRVLCSAMIQLADGRIVKQTNVQAWDT